MNESQIETMEQVRGFLQGAKTVEMAICKLASQPTNLASGHVPPPWIDVPPPLEAYRQSEGVASMDTVTRFYQE